MNDQTVWVVTRYDEILAVFSTKEAADTFASANSCHLPVERIPLDYAPEPEKCFRAWWCEAGTREPSQEEDPWLTSVSSDTRFPWDDDKKDGLDDRDYEIPGRAYISAHASNARDAAHLVNDERKRRGMLPDGKEAIVYWPDPQPMPMVMMTAATVTGGQGEA